MSDFVDRRREIETLRDFADRDRPALGLLYGRRRVGKTYLLDHALQDRRLFYFLATDTTPELNRRDLLEELSNWLERDVRPEDHPNWRLVFRLLARLAREEALTVVLDEFQYVTGTERDVPSQLTAIWDRELEEAPLTMFLCGSEVETMRDLGRGDAPLYGRFDWRAHLLPFDYFDTASMVPTYDERTSIATYGIFGGLPSYLEAVDSSRDLATNVVETMLSPRGEVHLQLEHLLEQEHGIRKPTEYRAVLRAVARGHMRINGIRQAAGLEDRDHAVRRVLDVLEDLELVEKGGNFDAGRTSPRRHTISDHAVRFWYRFVEPHASRLERGRPRSVWDERIEPELNTYLGGVFERVCAEAFERLHSTLELGFPSRWTRWEGHDRNRRPVEIDIVAELDDGRLLTGEIKWSSSPIDRRLHDDLRRDLEDLGASGRGWARDALDPDASAGHVYFSAAGFTDSFAAFAEDEPIYLVSLDDMFERVEATRATFV